MKLDEFRKDLEHRILWRDSALKNNVEIEDKNPKRISYELDLLRDLLITLDSCDGENKPTSEQLEHDGMLGVSLPTKFDVRDAANNYSKNRYYSEINLHETTVTDFEAGVKWLSELLTGGNDS